MARPRKSPEERKDKKITVYLNQAEEERLSTLSQALGRDKAGVIAQGLETYIKTLQDPPEPLKKARYGEILNQDKENLSGYICSAGHAFFIEHIWPAPPISCPCCGDRDIKSTWTGIITKGL